MEGSGSIQINYGSGFGSVLMTNGSGSGIPTIRKSNFPVKLFGETN